MRYLRPIPRRLLPDDMMVWPALGDGSFGEVALVRHVRTCRRCCVVRGHVHHWELEVGG